VHTPTPASPLEDDASATRPSQAHTRGSVGQDALAVLTAPHDPDSQCWRALREEDVNAARHPSSAPDPLVLEAAGPVITHSVALPRDKSMGRSTASHAGSLPKVPPSGRPPDRNDRPHGGANNCTAHLARYDSAEPTSAPTEAPTASPSNSNARTAPLLLEPVRASVCNTGSNCNALHGLTGCSRPYLPANHLSALGPLALGRRRSLDTSTGGGEGNTALAVTLGSKQSPTSAPTAAPTSAPTAAPPHLSSHAHLGSHNCTFAAAAFAASGGGCVLDSPAVDTQLLRRPRVAHA
jgi:hypothetical protein